jgi:propionyl-CoA carboxylase beta chain
VTHRTEASTTRSTSATASSPATARIHGRLVYVFSQDFTVFGGSLSEAHAEKIVKVMDLALKNGAPVIGLNDSGGARIQEGVVSLGGYADIFLRNTLASGVVPQISAILGPCAGGAVYSPAITDFVYMVRGTSYMFVTGPNVVKTVTHETSTWRARRRRRARRHVRRRALRARQRDGVPRSDPPLLRYLPQNNRRGSAAARHGRSARPRDEELLDVVPDEPSKPYDMHDVIRASSMTASSSRCTATSRGTSSSASRTSAGTPSASSPTSRPSSPACSTSTARVKGARFVRFCDAFNIPLVVFEDVPGFLPGVAQEHGGIIRHGAKLLYAFCEATVPRSR